MDSTDKGQFLPVLHTITELKITEITHFRMGLKWLPLFCSTDG